MNTNAEILVEKLSIFSRKLVTAESCTAGLVADLIAQVPGASRIFWGAFVCYTIEAKITMLGIDGSLIRHFGAVSREIACLMAEAALSRSGAFGAVSITGLAGPEGDGSETPVGTVWIATMFQGKDAIAKKFYFTGSRNEIRVCAASCALKELLENFYE
jgi:PncC family amidohydrolase